MQKQPDEMVICNLECLLMPNGEILSNGKSLGWFTTHGKSLTPLRYADGSPVEEGELK